VLYLALGIWWWPALAITLVLGPSAWRRGRRAADEFATLVESALDTHQEQLATAIGITMLHQRLTPDEGKRINDILRKGG